MAGGFKKLSTMPTSSEPLHKGHKLNWNFRVNLIGEKAPEPPIHFCEGCDKPIVVYGRMIPCKHVFCFDCATGDQKLGPHIKSRCLRCNEEATKVERCTVGQIFLCTFGAPPQSYQACRRTYLSKRDLDAHMQHRHVRAPQARPQAALTS